MATDYKFRITAQDKTKGAFNTVNKSIGMTQGSMKKLAGAFAGVFAVRQVVEFGRESLQMADSIGKTADSIGVGVEFLQRYQFVAQQAGLSTEEFNKSMQVFAKMTGEAATGTGEAKMAMEALGVSLRTQDGRLKTTEQLFIDFFKATDDVAAANKKAAYFADVFGRAGVKNTVMAKEGTAAMEELADAATGVFSEETIRSAENFNDQMNRLNRQLLTPIRDKIINIATNLLDVAEAFNLIEPEPVEESLESIQYRFETANVRILSYMEELKKSTNLTKDSIEILKQKIKDEMKVRDELGAQIRKHNNQMQTETKSAYDVIDSSIQGYLTSLKTVEERMGKAATQSMKKFEDSIINGLRNGKLEFQDFADFVIEQIARIAIQEAIIRPLTGTFTSFFGGISETLFGGARAEGGAVTGGTPYLVGEKGAELFIPNSSGQIITNENIKQKEGTQNSATVNFNISTVDAAGFDQLLTSRKGLITQIINNAMNTQGKMGIV